MADNRWFLTKEARSEQTTTATTPQSALAFGFQPRDNRDYLIIVAHQQTNDNASHACLVELDHNTASHLDLQVARDLQSTTDYFSFVAFNIQENGASPAYQEFDVTFEADNAGTAAIRDIAVIVIELQDEDEFSEAESTQTTTAEGAGATLLSLTFTPASTGDYLILSTTATWSDSFSSSWYTNLDKNPTLSPNFFAEGFVETEDTTVDYVPCFMGGREASVSGSNTWRIQYGVEPGSGATVSSAWNRLLALRLDDVMDTDTEPSTRTTISSASTTSSSFVDAQTLNPDLPSDGYYLAIATGRISANTSSDAIENRWLTGSTAISSDGSNTPNDSTNNFPLSFARVVEAQNGNIDYAAQHASSDGTTTVNMSWRALALLRLANPTFNNRGL